MNKLSANPSKNITSRFFRLLSLKAIFTVVTLLHLSLLSYSQTVESTMPSMNTTPQSPEATALWRFSDTPVSLYTGVPDINIPLYDLKVKGLSVPVSLSYHASGIKVGDMATNVGLGWVLNAGGAVTASVHGLRDHGDGGWVSGYPSFPRTPQVAGLQTSWEWNDDYVADEDYQFVKDASDDVMDTQPDLFYINVLGRTVKFYFDQYGQTYTVPHQRVKIVFAGNAFTFTDENDIQYEFSAVEMANSNFAAVGSGFTSPVDSWAYTYYLTKVLSPNGNYINFEYSDLTYTFQNQDAETRYVSQPDNFGCSQIATRVVESVTEIQSKRLSRILASTGAQVKFFYNLSRSDLPGTSALTSVEIIPPGTSAVAKRFLLTHDYFSGGGKLKLLGVNEEGLPSHTISYKTTSVPDRFSKSQDHWGYYNGAANTMLFPADSTYGFYTGADRNSNATYMADGIIQKVTYPTGGYTQFEFEANKYLSTEQVSPRASTGANALPNTVVSVPFTVATGASSFRAIFKAPTTLVYDPGTGNYVTCTVKILNNLGQTVQSFTGQSNIPHNPISALAAGNYSIEIASDGNYSDAYLQLSWTLPSYNLESEKIAGGLRIKEIINSTADGSSPDIIKKYEYTDDATGKSSGIKGFFVKYLYEHVTDHFTTLSVSECNYYAQSTQSMTPLGLVKGGSVAYTVVKEYTNDKTQAGYTRHKFFHQGGVSTQFYFPFAPVIAYDWVDGLPLETEVFRYDNVNSTYRPIKKEITEYKTDVLDPASYSNEHKIRGVKVVLLKQPIPATFGTGGPPPRGPLFFAEYYFIYSSWSYPTKKTSIEYDPNDDTKQVVTETSLYYDNPLHAEVTRQKISKSDSEFYNVTMRYPLDYNSGYAHNSSPVVEKRIHINNGTVDRLVGGEITTYKDHTGAFPEAYYKLNATAALVPSAVALYNGSTIDAAYEKRMDYLYDSNMNLLTVLKDGLHRTSYKWGYNNQYPVVEITNAAASVSSTGPGTQLKNVTIAVNATTKTESFVTTAAAPVDLTIYAEPGTILQLNYIIMQGSTLITSGTLCIDRVNTLTQCTFPETVTTASIPAGSYTITTEYQTGSDLTFPKTIGMSYQGSVTASSGDEFYYEGFEDGSYSATLPHTGLQSYSGDFTVNWSPPGTRSYVITYWYREAITGAWKFKEEQTYSGAPLTLSDGDAIDDIRIFPRDAMMSTYTYNNLGAMDSAADPKAQTTHYIYDSYNRLKWVKDQKGNIVTGYDYNYKQ